MAMFRPVWVSSSTQEEHGLPIRPSVARSGRTRSQVLTATAGGSGAVEALVVGDPGEMWLERRSAMRQGEDPLGPSFHFQSFTGFSNLTSLSFKRGDELLLKKSQVLIGKLRCKPTAPSTSLIFVDSFRLYLQRFWHVHLCFLSIGFCKLTSLYLQIFWHVFKCFQSIVFCGFGLAVPPEILACLVLQLCFSSNIGMVLRLSLVITSALMETGVQLNLSIYSCCGEGFYINKHVFASYNLLYFVCCHLTSGEKDGDELRRNLLSWRFPRERGCRDVKSPETILEQFRILWLGDLNCCICLPYS